MNINLNLNRSIRQKIQLYILGSVVIVYLIVFGFISVSNRKAAFDQTAKLISSYSDRYAGEIGSNLNSDMSALRTLASTSIINENVGIPAFMDLKNDMIRSTFKANPNVYSFWDSWEYSYIKPDWSKDCGRVAFTIWTEGGQTKESITERSLDGDPEIYAHQKVLKKENAFEPYMDVFAAGKAEAQMMTSLAVPLLRNGKFVGLMAEDVTLNQFQKLLEGIKPLPDAEAMLISQNGIIAGFPNKEMLSKKVIALLGKDCDVQVLDSIKNGKRFSFIANDSLGVERYFAFSPIAIGRDGDTWSLGISVPVSTIYQQTNRNFMISILVGLLGLALIWIINLILSTSITNPIKQLTSLLHRMARGEVSQNMKVNVQTHDELGDMSKALNQTLDSLIQKEHFANQIGKGDLNVDLTLMSEDDILGKSLLRMRNDLKKAKDEDEIRQVNDDRRRWAAETIAKINDIIRYNNHDIDLLCKTLVKEVVYSVDANQGGIFLLNEDNEIDVSYDLVAAFAYNRHKLMKRSFKPGEGLIGTCIAEKEPVYLTELPNDFVEITSGLGGANPKNILIVPFVHDSKVLGVLEIASFKLFAEYEREVVLKIADSFASAISFAKTGSITQKLLEQSEIQAEMMAAQEEEMRQNLEELRSTQEESLRQHNEQEGLIEAISKSVLWTEYDLNGKIVNVSDKVVQKMGISKDKLLGSDALQDYLSTGNDKDSFTHLWNNVRLGAAQRVVSHRKDGLSSVTVIDTYTPIRVDNETRKIIKVSYDITESMN